MTHFHTNIDCCKKFMPALTENKHRGGVIVRTSLEHAQPMVGDCVEVYRCAKKVVALKVVARTWRDGDLHIELHLPDAFLHGSILDFEKFVLDRE